MSSDQRRHRGFTLIELLVVLGIIAILISLLVPALATARESANQVKCAAQLHGLAQALLMYSNNNQGWLPDWSDWHVYPSGSPGDTPGLAWTEKLMPYYVPPDSPAYNCPSFGTTLMNYYMTARWSGLNGRHSVKLTDITMNSRFIVSGDDSQSHYYPPPWGTSTNTTDDVDRDDFGEALLAFPGEDGGFLMHRAGNNVLFDDGHVACFKSFDITYMTFHPHFMLAWKDVKAD
jgi:prepilin-type N-terminal cleavage/methylation domain-containing protein